MESLRSVLQLGNTNLVCLFTAFHDISIPHIVSVSELPLGVSAFGLPRAKAEPVTLGSFVGSPDTSGTHTECVGHVLTARRPIQECISSLPPLVLCALLSVPTRPFSQVTDYYPAKHEELEECVCVTELSRSLESLESLFSSTPLASASSSSLSSSPSSFSACVVRTLPNPADKPHRNYSDKQSSSSSSSPWPYFTPAAMEYLRKRGIKHLLVDTPSVDRESDEGLLAAHCAFWDIKDKSQDLGTSRQDCTITELCYVPDSVPQGAYLLSLQLSPIHNTDAVPSRPVLYPLKPV